jgi:predicted RNA-binding Zn-ribbon protein involved in translation (DUF1610 family)
MPDHEEGSIVEPIVLVQRKGEKAFPSVPCPRCGKAAVWIGRPDYARRVLATYACIEDDGCGATGSRPLRADNTEEVADVQGE